MSASKQRARIHITAVGSAAGDEVARLCVEGVRGVMELAQRGVGDRYVVTASEKMILAKEVDEKGGRFDDARRVREIETVLADDDVAALVTIRGGAWFTRLLDRIDWDVLGRRRRRIHIFGFSEMTTLIAIAGQYPHVVGLYDLGPGFLCGGMRRWVRKNIKAIACGGKLTPEQEDGFAAGWATARYPQAFSEFFGEVADIIDGKGSPRVPTGRLLAGTLPARRRITITGGNLSLIVAMLGSRFADAVETHGKWLAIEDLNEAADKLDRMLAGLKLKGLLERAEGIILGDFHSGDTELSDAVFEILKYHLPSQRRLPIVRIDNFGHVYPIAPIPMHREVTLRCQHTPRRHPRVTIEIPWAQWAR